MKKITLAFVLSINTALCFAQFSYGEDSLKKYSYFLQGYSDSTMSITQGTGFFINTNGENLLITAKHVLSGCKFSGVKDPNLPDEMLLYFNEDPNLNFRFFTIDLKKIKDTASCLQYYQSPDIISYPVTDTAEKDIYPVDQFLPTYLPTEKGKIVIFGYPSYNNMDSIGYSVRPATKLEIRNYELFETFTYENPDGSTVIDSINYTVKPTSVLVTAHLKGYSGSPVFIFDDQKEKWIFLGVVIAIDDKNNLLTIVKPKNLFEKLNFYY